jgi:hypothetical protein
MCPQLAILEYTRAIWRKENEEEEDEHTNRASCFKTLPFMPPAMLSFGFERHQRAGDAVIEWCLIAFWKLLRSLVFSRS